MYGSTSASAKTAPPIAGPLKRHASGSAKTAAGSTSIFTARRRLRDLIYGFALAYASRKPPTVREEESGPRQEKRKDESCPAVSGEGSHKGARTGPGEPPGSCHQEKTGARLHRQ